MKSIYDYRIFVNLNLCMPVAGEQQGERSWQADRHLVDHCGKQFVTTTLVPRWDMHHIWAIGDKCYYAEKSQVDWMNGFNVMTKKTSVGHNIQTRYPICLTFDTFWILQTLNIIFFIYVLKSKPALHLSWYHDIYTTTSPNMVQFRCGRIEIWKVENFKFKPWNARKHFSARIVAKW